MRSNVFAWSNLRAAFRWSNTRAAFVGSLAARERAETLELYHRVDTLYRRSRYTSDDAALDFTDEVVAQGCRLVGIMPRGALLEALGELVWQLLHGEPVFFWMPEREALNTPSLEREIELRQFLRKKEIVLTNPDRYERIWRDKIAILIAGFLGELPSGSFRETEVESSFAFSVMLSDLCGHTAGIVERIMGTMYDDDITHAGLFDNVRAQFEHNLASIMGLTPERALQIGKRAPMPTEMTGTHRRDIVHLFLGGTPFEALFESPLPIPVPQNLRFEHTHILAGSGHGKTQTLQHLILNDLRQPDPPSMVIIDSQGDMLSKISHLAVFDGALRDRLILIEPRDVEHPPALNMFDVNLERINRYGAADREQILNGVVELYEYFFGSLLGAELTQKQSLVFRYLARLMIQIPSANLRTMIELMDDLSPYKSIVERLPESSRMFFEKEFTDRQFGETRTQVKRRLYGIIENQTFERMFSSPRNRVDLPSALNEGKIVLVNTAKDFLKGNSSILGRYFIALTLQAALERAAIPEHQRRPAFLYIDEASEYFDTNVDNLLIQARKYKLGIVVAHQYLDQLQGGLRSSFAANTSIKLAGGVSDRDAHSVASDMRTTPGFILEQARGARETHFACYVRNVTPNAISISMPIGVMENEPQMSPSAYEELIRRNRERVSMPLMLSAPWEVPEPMADVAETEPDEPAPAPAPAAKSGSQKHKSKATAATDASPEW